MRPHASFPALGLGIFLASFSMPASALSWASVLSLYNTMLSEGSALAVNVKQTAVSANIISDSEANSKKQLANAIGSIDMSGRVIDAVESFSPEYGQPNSSKCSAQENTKLATAASLQSGLDSSRLMATFSSARVGSKKDAENEAIESHKSTYCTISESKQGMCALTGNGMQGWDQNYSGAFTEATLSPEGELAGYAFTSMITDTRAEAVADCDSTACEAAQASQLEATAFSAMAANSLIGQVADRRMPMLTGQ